MTVDTREAGRCGDGLVSQHQDRFVIAGMVGGRTESEALTTIIDFCCSPFPYFLQSVNVTPHLEFSMFMVFFLFLSVPSKFS